METGLIIMSTASKTRTMKSDDKFISDVIELQVVFDDEAIDSSDIDLDTLFKKVDESGTIPLTSQPTPGAISEAIDKALETYEKLIIITPHSEISGTYQNCVNVANEKSTDIKVFEVNGGIATTESLLIDRALELLNANCSYDQLVDELTEYNKRLVIYTFPGDFEYLKVSGRVSGAAALLLNALNIRVVIKMEGGKPTIDNKGRGDKSVLKYIDNEFSNKNVEKVYYTPINDNPKLRDAVTKLLASKGLVVEMTDDANSVPAAHLGPNNFGLGIVHK